MGGCGSPCRRIFLLGIAHPVVGPPFQVQGVYKEATLRRGRDYEEGRCVALILPLSNIFVKNILYKRIVTKFFWDYCLNSRGM